MLGAVYEISEQCLRRLDRHEGYPDVYNRFEVTVFTEDGEPVQATTYIKVDQSEETAPAPAYVSVIQQGYKDWEIV